MQLTKHNFEDKLLCFNRFGQQYLIHTFLKQQHPKVYACLKTQLDPNGVAFPTSTIDLVPSGNFTINNVINDSRAQIQHDPALLNWLTNTLNKCIENNPTFTLNALHHSAPQQTAALDIGLGDYASTLSTSDIHYFNLVAACPETDSEAALQAYVRSPEVKQWVTQLQPVVLERDFSGYCASMGCSVLTLLKQPRLTPSHQHVKTNHSSLKKGHINANTLASALEKETDSPEKYRYLFKKNAVNKASSGMDYHVIPSFMYQPTVASGSEQARELDLTLGIIREFGEEVLGFDELEQAESVDQLLQAICSIPLLDTLQQEMASGLANLQATGVVLDIFRLRPEFTFLLIIHDEQFSQHTVGNWESDNLVQVPVESPYSWQDFMLEKNASFAAPAIAALINAQSYIAAHLDETTRKSTC